MGQYSVGYSLFFMHYELMVELETPFQNFLDPPLQFWRSVGLLSYSLFKDFT